MECVNVLLQYVNDPRPARQAEYEECVRRNLQNPSVKLVHNLQEHPKVVVPEEFASHPKFRSVSLGRWMTFRDAFDYANSTLPGETWCIINLDIFLDSSADWASAAQVVAAKIVFCLSRTEFVPGEGSRRDPALMNWAFANSQDAWLFRAPIQIDNCDFPVGTIGCDNAIAHRIKQAGYMPINAGQQFCVHHYDRARGKTVGNQNEIHAEERKGKVPRTYPEREGQYLLPDIDVIRSVDKLLDALKVTDLDRYSVICDVMNRFLQVHNP
jgi:hypothetical protein